jgi:hypothetical protein
VVGGLEQEFRLRHSRSLARGSCAPVSARGRTLFQESADLLVRTRTMVERATKKP